MDWHMVCSSCHALIVTFLGKPATKPARAQLRIGREVDVQQKASMIGKMAWVLTPGQRPGPSSEPAPAGAAQAQQSPPLPDLRLGDLASPSQPAPALSLCCQLL